MQRTNDQRSQKRIDLFVAALLATATVLTAWCAFQSAKWSGRRAIAFSQSMAARIHASELADLADQERAIDVSVFVAWVQAVANEEDAEKLRERGYRPTTGTLSAFLFERFRDEFEPAVHAWLATDPFRDADAPSTPFRMPQYRLASSARAQHLHAEAERRSSDARDYVLRSDRYVALTVMCAMALFFAGIGTKFESLLIQRMLLGFAGVVLAGAGIIVAFLPVAVG